jgi:hypothetical protein
MRAPSGQNRPADGDCGGGVGNLVIMNPFGGSVSDTAPAAGAEMAPLLIKARRLIGVVLQRKIRSPCGGCAEGNREIAGCLGLGQRVRNRRHS